MSWPGAVLPVGTPEPSIAIVPVTSGTLFAEIEMFPVAIALGLTTMEYVPVVGSVAGSMNIDALFPQKLPQIEPLLGLYRFIEQSEEIEPIAEFALKLNLCPAVPLKVTVAFWPTARLPVVGTRTDGPVCPGDGSVRVEVKSEGTLAT